MCGEMMIGTCDVCGKEHVELRRKYYYYGIKCQCHSPEHFEIVEHCKDCEPIPPSKTVISIQPSNERILK